MKLSFIVAVILLATITGCKSKTAFNYSEKIVKLERDLGPEIAKTEKQMAKFLETQAYDSVISISSHMENMVESKLEIIRNTQAPTVPEADNFKKAAIRYFTYMKSIYSAYKNYASQTEEEGREKARQEWANVAEQGDDEVNSMQMAQRKYAKANNFKIREENNKSLKDETLKESEAKLKDKETELKAEAAKLEEMKKAASDEKK